MKKTFTLFAIITTTYFFAQIPSYVPTDGLVAYYPFNGNANDLSGNSLNGTINGSVTPSTDRSDNPNSAYLFAGNSSSYLSFGTPNLLKIQDEITISVWFTMNGGFFNPRVLQYGCGGQEFNIASIGTSSGSRQISAGINGLIIVVNNVTTNVWHHILYSAKRSSGNAKLYLDGSMVNSLNTSPITTNITYSTDFNIGRMACPANDAWGGKIDDIGIWNRVLTPEEITNLYYAENSCQTLVINTGVLGFNPPTYKNTVTIYPNPANDHITIDCGNLANVNGWNIKISNTLGQEVFSGKMDTQQYTVPLNTWGGKGVYFVKIYDNSDTLMNTKKIILQ